MKNNTLKILDFLIYWAIIILPFSVGVSNAMMNVFMGFIIGFFVIKKIIAQDTDILIDSSINIPLLVFFIITSISLFNSVSFKDTFRGGILRLLQYITVFLVMTKQVKDKKHIMAIIIAAIAGLSLASLDSIWQVFTGKDFIRGYDPVINLGIVRATASFKDSNTLGIYLSALAPLLFGVTMLYFKGIKRTILILISLLVLAGITLTYSRPTLLAIYIVLLFLAIIGKKKIIISLLLLLAILFPFILPQSVKNWAKEDADYNPIRFMCNNDRIAIYRNSFNMIKAHPVIGVGGNTFMKNYKFYKESPEYRNVVTADSVCAHNNFIQMAAEIGIVGLLIFLWFLTKVFIEIRNIYKKLSDNFYKVVLISITACLIAFLINGLTESSLYYSRVAILFWYLLGFAFVFKNLIKQKIA